MKKVVALVLAVMLAFTMLLSSVAVFAEEVSDVPEVRIKGELSVNSAEKTILYVAKDGSDSNNGSFNSPFASFEKARDTIRSLKSAGQLGAGGAVVYIREGEYLIQNAIEFTAEDSGTKEAPIVYRNYPDERVSLVGGANINPALMKKVTSKTVLDRIVDSDARQYVMEFDLFSLGYKDLPELTWPGGYSYSWAMQQIHGKEEPTAVAPELIINNEAMTIARYPNDGYMTIDTIVNPGENVRNWYDDRKGTPAYIPPEDRKNTPFTIGINDDRLSLWGNAKEALITGYFYFSWANQTVPIDKINTEKKEITSKYPSEYSVLKGQTVYVYNLLEEIDVPGEYYVDRATGKLYLYPPEGTIESIIYTTLEDYMFNFSGAEYIKLKGFDMSYMRSGAIKMHECNNCEIINCSVNYTGKHAMDITGKENKVYDSYVTNADGGIRMTGGDRQTLTPGNNIMENNELDYCDRITKTYMEAARIAGVGNYMLHNKIHNSSHKMVGFAGNDQVIAFNEIYDAVKYADDMGAIYSGRTLTARGNIIAHNYIHDIGSEDRGSQGVQGIFLDDWWSAADIYGNVFENIAGAAIKLAGSHNKIYNNVIVNSEFAGYLNRSYSYGAVTNMDNTFAGDVASVPYLSDIWLEKYPEIENVVDENGIYDVNNCIEAKNNLLYKTQPFKISSEISHNGTFENNVVFKEDPGFIDAEGGNYLLKQDAEVYEAIEGFETILFTRMGMYSERAIERVKDAYVYCLNSPYTMEKGERIKNDKEIILVRDGKMYIPLRTGAELVGGTVEFDEASATVTVSTASKTLAFTSGGQTKGVTLNGTDYELSDPIVNIEYTNYISLEDLAIIFEKYITKNSNIVVFSDIETLFYDGVDDGLLRYIEEQLTIY